MHILTIRSALSDSGPGTQPLSIAKEMRARGHTTVFVTSGGAYVDTIRAAGFTVHIVPELAHNRHNPPAIVRAIFKLRGLIKVENPDVIHNHNAAATVCGFIAASLAGRRLPMVTSVRGVEERSTHQWRNQIWKRLPGVLLGVCEKTRARLLSFGIADDKIQVTYNGVDLSRFYPGAADEAAEREKLGLTGKIVVGTTGAIVGQHNLEGPTKGQHNLIKAVAKLKPKHPNLAVLLVGDGPARDMVAQTAQDAGIQDDVVFAGKRFDVPEMLSAMDIYCLASIFGEFFPNSIIEAMAMGKPWVGSDIAGLGELTAQNEAGWVSPIGDVDALAANLDRLLSDSDLRHKRGQAAIAEVQRKFSIAKVADRILAAYVDAGVSQGLITLQKA